MHCEFTKLELIMLDMALMDRAMSAKDILFTRFQGKREPLEEKIRAMDALHDKVNTLIQQASEESHPS